MSASLPSNVPPDNNSTTTNTPYLYAPPQSALYTHAHPSHSQPSTYAPPSQPPQQSHPISQALPPSIPFSESDNPDAIALRAAMSILQMQRQQAIQDLKTLERQKQVAIADPESFGRDVAEGKIRARPTQGILPATTYSADAEGYDDDDDDDDMKEMDDTDTVRGHLEGDTGSKSDVGGKSFGDIPTPQNVVRMPPINWAKYHIVGESLDKLHEEQRSRPMEGRVMRDEDLRAPETVIARPYDPWVDRVGAGGEKIGGENGKGMGGRTRSGGKKG
ncbi:hypothetical protein MMC28_002118 [Mycoblastus sanguinarius]|nr:hypothetical protein [Mycoblastus sanguinarius]